MTAEIATAVVAASGAVVLAGASYWFTKKGEREAELRKEKLEHYKDFTASLSGIISGEGTPEGQRAYSRACNKLNLIAPHAVLEALQAFQSGTRECENATLGRHDQLMSALFLQIRKDLGVSPADDESTFKVGLWASGVRPVQPQRDIQPGGPASDGSAS